MIGRGPLAKDVCVVLSGRGGGAFGAALLKSFGSAHHEFASHEFLVVEIRDSAFCFIHRLHLHKGKSLGAHVVAIHNDFDILH